MERLPLGELPLDRFLPPNPSLHFNLSPTKLNKASKRPLSPGTPSLFSPAKRRILNGEGIFLPDKSIKSPVALRSNSVQSLTGPNLARKLDFGAASRSIESQTHIEDNQATPTRFTTPSRHLAPSPELPSTPQSSKSRRRHDTRSTNERGSPAPLLMHNNATPMLIPREPIRQDPQSIHFPGFHIYQDPHIMVGPSSSATRPQIAEKEGEKENQRPRQVARKSLSFAKEGGTSYQLPSPSKSTNSSPQTPRVASSLVFPSPRSLEQELTRVTVSTPRRSQEEIRRMRQLLEDEVNDIGSDDDDEENALF